MAFNMVSSFLYICLSKVNLFCCCCFSVKLKVCADYWVLSRHQRVNNKWERLFCITVSLTSLVINIVQKILYSVSNFKEEIIYRKFWICWWYCVCCSYSSCNVKFICQGITLLQAKFRKYTVTEQGVFPPGAKYIYGCPYWCSRNTFISKIAAPVKVPPSSHTICSVTGNIKSWWYFYRWYLNFNGSESLQLHIAHT